MNNGIYKMIEIVGSSTTSIEDAIEQAIERAHKTLDHLDWFEVVQTRGYVENGKVKYYQVMLKIGFRLKD